MAEPQFRACQTSETYREHHTALAAGLPSPIASFEPPDLSPESTIMPPAMIFRAINFAKAVFAQAPLAVEALLTGDDAAAFRNREEIEVIAAVCKGCPLFNGQVCTHKDCGCAIDEERNAWWSKIAWRSQKCPDDPPRWR